jgi:proline dehydrogenase
VLDQIRERRLDGEISVKLTQLGFDLDMDRTFQHASSLAAQAAESGKSFWIDMEGSDYVEATIAFYEDEGRSPEHGDLLQAYLKRTATSASSCRRRSGWSRASRDPAIAYQTRHDVDANYLALCVAMPKAPRRRTSGRAGTRRADRVAEHAAVLSAKTNFEVQMLRHPDGSAATARP